MAGAQWLVEPVGISGGGPGHGPWTTTREGHRNHPVPVPFARRRPRTVTRPTTTDPHRLDEPLRTCHGLRPRSSACAPRTMTRPRWVPLLLRGIAPDVHLPMATAAPGPRHTPDVEFPDVPARERLDPSAAGPRREHRAQQGAAHRGSTPDPGPRHARRHALREVARQRGDG